MSLRNFPALVPLLIVLLSAIATMVLEAIRRPGERMPMGGLGIIGLIGSIVSSVLLWNTNAGAFGVVTMDNFAIFICVILAIVGILTVVFSSQVLERDGVPAGDYYALVLFGTSGMMLMASATDLLVIFLALEILSLSAYVLTGIRRSSEAGAEGAFKYFLLGAFSSAFFLYGIAFTFAVTRTTRLGPIGTDMAARALDADVLTLLAVGLLLVGFAFKVSAVPFHMWTPDAYEGASPVVGGFMSTGVKAAAFAAFARVFLSAFEPMRASWIPVLWTIAALTMIVGTFVGVTQNNVKRMLAYSSIAHAGYLLIGIVAANSTGKAALLFYLLAYAVTNVGAFAVIALVARPGGSEGNIRDFAGLWQSRPAAAALMTIILLSLGGFPPTAGFIGKWYIFSAAVQAGYVWLAIIGVLTSVVSVFFYLRVVVMMYMSDEKPLPGLTPFSRVSLAGLSLAVLVVLYLGILPTPVLTLAANSISTIF